MTNVADEGKKMVSDGDKFRYTKDGSHSKVFCLKMSQNAQVD